MIVPNLRAGIGMVDGRIEFGPAAKVGRIGMYRDEETLQPVEYLVKITWRYWPTSNFCSWSYACNRWISDFGCWLPQKTWSFKHQVLYCLVSAPEGVKALQAAHPDVEIFTAALDERLNEHGYIVPGLGDAGDRLFGTK